MSGDQKRQLEQQLWNIANELRGKMNADEFRDYILGFIFYKYLSEKQHLYANKLLKGEKIEDYRKLTDPELLAAIKNESLETLGYFLEPDQLFDALAKKGNSKESKAGEAEAASNYILDDLDAVLTHIEQSTMGTESEEEFTALFEDVDLQSTKLGRSVSARNELIAKVLAHLNKIDFKLEDANADVLGDAYEYLIGQFAAGAGKKAGEFYTPQEVSTILARIVTTGKKKLRSVYDPTCGSGSLLLRVAKEVKVAEFYGQELNRTTFNLCRMNMILHGVHYRDFDIQQEDTLEAPKHLNLRFEAVVANPPFSAQWKGADNPLHLNDERFSEYGRLAPTSKADFAFLQHMIYQLADNGTMACVLPHGVLFRGAAEGHIRQHLIKEMNYLDAVIGLPANLFYGTGIPACILVLKKCRQKKDSILFIDASGDGHFERAKNQNVLRDKDVDLVVETYRDRKVIDKFSYEASLAEIEENDWNLNIPRYVNTYEGESAVDLATIAKDLSALSRHTEQNDKVLFEYCAELGIPMPDGYNIRLLKEYKKGLTQLLFDQTLRFTDDDKKSFPAWEARTLGELAEKVMKKNTNLSLTAVLTNSATQGVVDQSDYFDKDIANQDNLAGYYVVEINDFVYNPRISVTAPVGPLKRNKLRKGVMSPLYTVIRFKAGNLDFFEAYFEAACWHRYMCSVANYGVRHDRMNVSSADFFAMPLPFPTLAEQKKIADCLVALERKIEAVEAHVSTTRKLL